MVIPGSRPVDRHYVRPDRDKFHTVSAAAGEDIPLALLAGMVDDNPWKDVLAASEGNPFSRAIQDMIEGSGDETGAVEAGDDAGKPGTGDQEHAQDHSDEGTPQGDDGSTTDNGYNGGGDSGNSNLDGNYPKMVMLSGWDNGISTDYVYQYDSDIYSTADGTMSQLAVKWIPGHSPLDQFYFCDDFNSDGRADVLQTLRLKGICQLLLNTGFSWAGLRPFYLPYQPSCLTRMICMDPNQPQLVVYSAQAKSVDILEDLGDGRFESMLDFPMPTAYDGLAASDFNYDGYDDYIFLAVTENRVNYLINVDGQSLRPLITAPYFPSPRNYRFTANPGSQRGLRLMLLNYRRQCLLYWVDIYGRGVPVLGVTRLDPGTCILVGDINDDGIPDVGFGHNLR